MAAQEAQKKQAAQLAAEQAAAAAEPVPEEPSSPIAHVGAAFNHMGDVTRRFWENTFSVFSFSMQKAPPAPLGQSKSALALEAAPAEEAAPPAASAGAGQL